MQINNPPEIPRLLATVATTGALPANTYNNGQGGIGATITANVAGAWTVDGHVLADGDTVLVKNEVASENNGLYLVLTAGTGSALTTLQRVDQMNQPNNFVGVVVPTSEAGSTLANTLWICNAVAPVVVGTTAIPFAEIVAGGGGPPSGPAGGALAGSYPNPGINGQFDVMQYGAAGDGTTDDTAAFNVAIAALNANGGGVLKLPSPSVGYKLTGSLTPLGNALIIGAGSTLLVSGGNPLWTLTGNVIMTGLVFNITSGHTQVKLTGPKCHVNDVTFENGTFAGACIEIASAAVGAVVSGCFFDTTNSFQTILIEASDALIESNVFENTNPGGYPVIVIAANVSHFNINGNIYDGASSANSVVVTPGTSDWYIIAGNNFNGIPISDGGTGTNKLINDNPVRSGGSSSSDYARTFALMGG